MNLKPENQNYEIDLIELFHVIRKKILYLVLCVLLCGGAGFVCSYCFIIPQYEASVTMIVNSHQEGTASITNDQFTSSQKLISTYSVIIKSNIVMNQVINNLGLKTTDEKLADRITVSSVDNTQIMEIVVRDPDPATALSIIHEIAKIAPKQLVDIVEAGSCKVASHEKVSSEPVSPNLVKNTIFGAVIGLLLALTGIIIWYYTKERHIVTDEDVKLYLELPLLGMIPEVED